MPFIYHVFSYNIILSILIYAMLLYKPRVWLHRMPPDILNKVPKRTEHENKILKIYAIPFSFFFFFYPAIITFLLWDGFLNIFKSLLIFSISFAIWDTLILDLLIFCSITPQRMVIEGTTKADYKNKKYHLQAGFKGLIISVIYSLLFAAILILLKTFL